MEKKYDLCIIGSLCDCDLVFAEHAARLGFKCLVIRKRNKSRYTSVPEGYITSFDMKDMITEPNIFNRIHLLKSAKLIVSLTGALMTHLKGLWPLRRVINLPPVINITTGADLGELVDQKGLVAHLYRSYLNYCDYNWILPWPHSVLNSIKYKVPRVILSNGFPFIYNKEKQKDTSLYKTDRELTLFHPSHLDWNASKHEPHRNQFKCNDVFIYAIIKAIRDNIPFKLTILDRGQDAELARQIFEKAGVADSPKINWKSHMDRDTLYQTILESDIVVNMFGHGGAGGISFESLAMGCPVMQRAHYSHFSLTYKTMAPFINCTTSKEIYNAIAHYSKNREDLITVSRDSFEWADKLINPENSMHTFVYYYSLLTGDMKLDLGGYPEKISSFNDSIAKNTYDPFDFDTHLNF